MNFIKKHIKKTLFCTAIFVLIIIIGLSSSEKDEIGTGGNIIGSIFSNFQKITYSIGQTFGNAFYSVQSISKTKEENIALTENIHKLQNEIRMLKSIVSRSEALENEYKLRSQLEYEYIIGQVIALDDSNWFSRFTVDKGTKDGINKNDIVIQAVESEEGMVQIGIVGIITETGDNWAKAVTLLDETCKISFKDINNDECGIIEGSINAVASGYFFNSKAEAQVGDSLVTSGIGDIYLPDMYIGQVSEVVSTTDASMQKILVETAVDFTKLYRVFILKINR